MLPVKWYDWQMGGIPQLTGVAGALIAILDAVLVNGFNSKSVTSLTVASNVATATVGTGHGFVPYQVIEIAGAAPSGLNNQWRVTSISSATITFNTTGVEDGTATGTITCKAPAAGWEKVYSGTNKAVYRSGDVGSTRALLRVDDTNATYALVRGYEAMTDIDTGTGPFPTTGQSSTGLYWMKSSASGSTARPYTLAADSRLMHLAFGWNQTASAWQTANYEYNHFGDYFGYRTGDLYRVLLSGAGTSAETGIGSHNSSTNFSSQSIGYPAYSPRDYTGLGSALPMYKVGTFLGITSSNVGIPGRGITLYPNPNDNGLYLSSITWIMENATNYAIRGEFPGVLVPLQLNPLQHLDVVTDVVGAPSAMIMMFKCTDITGNGRLAIDLIGPWKQSS